MRLISVYTVYTEKVQSHGRVDCIVETPDYVYILNSSLTELPMRLCVR